ncbi:MAG: hypothetical protein ACLQIB_44850 [Isosphaeraceae bacterium]
MPLRLGGDIHKSPGNVPKNRITGVRVGIIRKAALWELCRARHKFHGCALAAFLDQAEVERGWPSLEATRRRAFDYYEQELAAKNAAKR